MEDIRPQRLFLQTYLGTFALVVLTVYAPYIWLFVTDAGDAWLKYWLALPGLPSFLLLHLGASMEQSRLISLCLAAMVPLTAAFFFRLFPNHRRRIAASALAYSLVASFLAYRLALA
jgi:hypothetical protein